MNKQVVEFLQNIEESHPLGAHAKFYDAWAEDVRGFADEAGILQTEDDMRTLDLCLTIRGMAHEAAVGSENQGQEQEQNLDEDADSWKWLLTAKQVEQRTTEWYQETRNMLTASEVATVFKTGRTRGSLVMAKASPPAERFIANLAVERKSTGPMDWGVRYEPVVKEHLEKTLTCKIHDLGRIRHRTDPKIAASPDGLIVSCEADKSLIGRLTEIKCPSTRVIKEGVVPFEYWCQMQLQMEVCGVDACEFVEAKFREYALVEEKSSADAIDSGFISLVVDNQTEKNMYVYHSESSPRTDDHHVIETYPRADHTVIETYPRTDDHHVIETYPRADHTVIETYPRADHTVIETYGWELIKLRRITVLRDVNWFAQSQPAFEAFWKDVEGAKAGTWTLPPARPRKEKEKAAVVKCEIVDESG